MATANNNTTNPKPNPCRSVGACVRVTGRSASRHRQASSGGVGFVVGVNDDDNTIDVRYTVEERNSQDIVMSRVSLYNLESTIHTTQNNKRQGHGLLSTNYVPTQTKNKEDNQKKKTGPAVKGVMAWLSEACHWTPSKRSHPILSRLCNGRKKYEKGWVRVKFAKDQNLPIPSSNKQLSPNEKKLIVDFYFALKTFPAEAEWPGFCGMADLAYGFGVSTTTIKNVDKQYLQNNFSLERKKRSDAGSNLISSERK